MRSTEPELVTIDHTLVWRSVTSSMGEEGA
jgi:hypothetical protein